MPSPFTIAVNISKTDNKTISSNTNDNTNTDLTKPHNYQLFPEENINLLKVKVQMLEGKKSGFLKIDTKKRPETLNAWLNSLEDLQPEIGDLLSKTVEGVGRAKKWDSTRDTNNLEFANKVDSMLKVIEELEKQALNVDQQLEKQGVNVDELSPPAEALENNTNSEPAGRLIGLECKLTETLKYIKGTEYAIIGIVGACGIGKTTLLGEIGKTVKSNNENGDIRFTKVISVPVEKEFDVNKIKHAFAEKLLLVGEGDQNFDESEHHKLSEALSREPILIMLDGIWDEISFPKIGIDPQNLSPSKIVYTTRLKHICERMNPDKIVEMKYLDLQHSLELFKAVRYQVNASADQDIENIVKKCGGLPLALSTLSKATAGRDTRYIYNCMTDSPTEIDNFVETVFRSLKCSFDNLRDEMTKSCFLFCVLFQDSKHIDRHRLIEYWIGEGLVQVKDPTLAKLRSRANDIVIQLLVHYLLEQGQLLETPHVWMHGIVHSMAVWLANDKFEFYAGQEFDNNVIDRMKRAKRAFLVDNHTAINEILNDLPDCENLATLLVGLSCPKGLASKWIAEKSFHKAKMPSICVLDLAYQPVSKLPPTVRHLTSLRYLNLSYTLLKSLPAELGELTNLIQLDLTSTKCLRRIPGQAILPLVNLKTLTLGDSAYCIDEPEEKPTRPRVWFGNSKPELSLSALYKMMCLAELQLPLRSFKTLEKLSKLTKLKKVTSYLQLPIYYPNVKQMFEILERFENLEMMSFSKCELELPSQSKKEISIDFEQFRKLKILVMRDESYLSELSFISPLQTQSKVQLQELRISSCSRLTSITCLCQLQNLHLLVIEDCKEMGQLLSLPPVRSVTSQNEHATSSNHQDRTECLASLKSLILKKLPKLHCICDCNLSFEWLEAISVHQCENLKKLTINPINEERKVKMECGKEWWAGLNWEEDIIKPSSFIFPFLV